MEESEIHVEAEVSQETSHGRGRGYHGRGSRGYPRGGRGVRKYVPKGQGGEEHKHGDGDAHPEGEEAAHQDDNEHRGHGKGYRQYHQGHGRYGGGRGNYRGGHGGYGRGRQSEGPPDEYKNYWRYHNEERKPTVDLPKPDEMKA